MRSDGWTWGDLAGEMIARGIDPDDVSACEYLDYHTPKAAARAIYQSLYGDSAQKETP